jgi:hypothetical protein
MMSAEQRAAALVTLVVCGCLLPAAAAGAPVLRSAAITVTATTATSCDVDMTVTVDGATTVEHRVDMPPPSQVTLLAIGGATANGAPRSVGRTQSIIMQIERPTYALRYRVQQPESLRGRCPLWLPTIPADGFSRNVQIDVNLPPGMSPGTSMPPFAWRDTRGSTRLGHIPAFVLVPFAPAGLEQAWDITLAMDVVAVAVFVVASGLWLWRRRRA